MRAQNKKQGLSEYFNDHVQLVLQSAAAGAAITAEFLHVAVTAGLLTAAAPVGLTALAVGSALLAGGIVATEHFNRAAKREAQRQLCPVPVHAALTPR
ncbi:MAG: hypothetical protein KGL10_09935 [Alphaproteobacteria bacterium]|nr:hypothetical protein [Alphaproteobacteria bacterium]MDE2337619.1 hypothetical protein [Alphaproteobacteria bacterium]